jgi:hypothetical protein
MNLYFQFLTQNQTAEASKMLQAISFLTGDQACSGRVKVSAQGTISRSTFSDIEDLSAKMANRRFNELEVLPDPLPRKLGGGDARITALNGVFYPSPTGALWLATKDWQIDADRSSRNKYMTAKTKEDVLKFFKATTKPSVFEIALRISTKSSQGIILEACAGCLARMLPESLGKLGLFGCCDVGGSELGVALDTGAGATHRIKMMARIKPPTYAKLGDKFENLHPLMFGSKRICEGISKALGKEASLTITNREKNFAIICLSPIGDMESARKRAARWLIDD